MVAVEQAGVHARKRWTSCAAWQSRLQVTLGVMACTRALVCLACRSWCEHWNDSAQQQHSRQLSL